MSDGEFLHEVGQEHEGNPQAAAETHGEIDHVGDARRGLKGTMSASADAHADEGNDADDGEADHAEVFEWAE